MALTSALTSICPQHAICKCCGSTAALYGVVDFNKNCEVRYPAGLPVSGIPIYYHRCPQCGFIFTIAFDHFSNDDFLKQIYNDTYAAVDPDYAGFRPDHNAKLITELFGDHRQISILDYGGGNGLLAGNLRLAGFTDITTYDPFVPAFSARPGRTFELITCFEVMEHSPQPRQTLSDIDSLLQPYGLIFMSTLLQPPEIEQFGLTWKYAGPRNGHISLFTPTALNAIFSPRGFKFGSWSDNMHAAWRQVPEFARKLLPG